jgi:2-methylcitrate dehydratase PrpD
VPTPTDALASFATQASYDSLPESARRHARSLLLDAVACALAGHKGDEVAAFTHFARAVGGAGDSTLIGLQERLSPFGATLLNGYLITAVTVCDVYVPAHVHITPEVVPPALAVAERSGVDGRALLTAIAVGAETAVRVAAGLDYSVAGPMGWHFPGIVGPFGAAAAAGRLIGLDEKRMRSALGLAGSQAAGTWASWGTPAVKFHQARGAGSGLLAALLAEQDFAASADVLGNPDGGMFTAYSDGGKPERVTAELGSRYEFEQISLRLWPGGTPLQPTLTALFDLLARERPDFSAIERVRIFVAPDVYEAHARFADPQGVFEALLSYPFAVASALRDGSFWLASVERQRLEDSDLRRLMRERVELVAEPALTREQSRIEIATKGGSSLSAHANAAKGTPGNPANEADLLAKFDRCAAGRLSQAEARELADLLVRIDEVDDLSRLFALMRGGSQASAAA